MFCGLAAAIAPARSLLVTGVTDVRPRGGVAICGWVSPTEASSEASDVQKNWSSTGDDAAAPILIFVIACLIWLS